MAEPLNTSPHAVVSESVAPLRIAGILLIVLGVVGCVLPGVAALSTSLVVGTLLLIAGGVLICAAFSVHGGRRWADLLYALLAILVGGLMLFNPIEGAFLLAWLATAWFICAAIFSTVAAFRTRSSFTVINAVCNTLIALLFLGAWFTWPTDTIGMLGIYASVSILFWGIDLMFAARVVSGITTDR